MVLNTNLRCIPKEWISHLRCGRSLNLCKLNLINTLMCCDIILVLRLDHSGLRKSMFLHLITLLKSTWVMSIIYWEYTAFWIPQHWGARTQACICWITKWGKGIRHCFQICCHKRYGCNVCKIAGPLELVDCYSINQDRGIFWWYKNTY